MHYVVAVSGGVDSITLLHVLAKNKIDGLVVAHFDHGIRSDSSDDAEFVGRIAKQYNIPFEMKREELGPQTSEAFARERRYLFLRSVAKKYQAKIITAHHADDVVETVILNFKRGTGWRGLAVLDSSDIIRPFLNFTKAEITTYAKHYGYIWHEDSTNRSNLYLRNRIRHQLIGFSDDSKRQILALRASQINLKKEIETEVNKICHDFQTNQYSRYFFIYIDELSALEILRNITAKQLTRPQLRGLILAIKTARPGKVYQAGCQIAVHFTTRYFTFKMIK